MSHVGTQCSFGRRGRLARSTACRSAAAACVAVVFAACSSGGGPGGTGVSVPPPTKSNDPTIVSPSNYSGGTATAKITQSLSTYYAATIAPLATDSGSYTLTAADLSSAQTRPTIPVSRMVATSLAFDAKLRALEQQLATRLPRTYAAPLVQPAAVGSTATFWVITDPTTLQQQQITATLQATSTHALLYVDNANLGSYPTGQAASLLQTWEAQIYPTDTGVFGAPQNPYNSNGQGQITLLITQAVGGSSGGGTVIGYFFFGDLYPDSTTFPATGVHSNQADIIYMNSNLNSSTLLGDMAHEFQHLINYSQHVFVNNGPAETTWINEGLSMLAEDLVGYGYQAGSSGSTLGLAQAFFAAPNAISLWNFGNTVANYGAAWLFFRYLADRFGNQAVGRLDQTAQTGTTNIESHFNEQIGQLISEQASAVLSMSFNLGLGSPYRYTSINAGTIGTTPALSSAGTVTINSGGYLFYGFSASPSLPAHQVTIQAGTATPWATVAY